MSYDLLINNIGQMATPPARRVAGREMNALTMKESIDIGILDGKIERIGDLKGEKARSTLDAKRKLVLPGFVDSHTHLVFDGTRERELDLKLQGVPYLEILKRGGGILYTVKKTREAAKEKLVRNGKKLLDSMLSFGTTTVEAKSGYGLDLDTEIKLLEVMKELDLQHPIDVIPTFLGAHALPPEYKNDKDAYLDLMIDSALPIIRERKLAKYCDVFLEKGVFDVEDSRRLMTRAMKHGLMPKLHVDEIANIGGSRLAAELKAVSADHLAKTTKEDMKLLAENNVVGNLLPGTSFMLMKKDYAPARQMVEHDMCLALSTDFNPNCWVLSMPVIMTLGCYCMKMTVGEALSASTINGAASLCLDHVRGSITEGKQADLVVLDLENVYQLPYMFATNPVVAVVKRGEVAWKKELLSPELNG